MPDRFIKDPDAVLDYVFDWAPQTNGREGADSDWLAADSGETITSYVMTVETGLIKDSDSLTDDDTSVTVWLSGGAEGQDYSVACKITTSAGRTDERTAIFRVRQR